MKLFCKTCSKAFPVEPGDQPVVQCPGCGKDVVRPETELSPGVVVGDFLIEEHLSKGGMGEVFVARQISLDRQVALKVLRQEFTHDKDYVESLFREARAAAKISHPNIVQAYAVGQDDGIFYFAMELVRGDTLKNILRKDGALPVEKAARIIRDIANALDVAWREQKLVHQDIKPDNIMLDVNGFSKLADLGLAKTASTEEDKDDSDEVLGTPQYISPEQLTGVPTDVRSDIYSLGATFYHIVTGKLPYRAADMNELAKMHDAGDLTPPKERRPDLPDELDRIIVKMMARDIAARYQSPAELVDELDKFLKNLISKEEKDTSAGKPVPGIAGKKLNIPGGKISLPPKKATVPAVKPVIPRPVAAVQTPPAVKPVVPRPAAAVPTPAVKPTAPAPVVPGEKSESGKKSKSGGKKKIWILISIILLLLILGGGGAAYYFLWYKAENEEDGEIVETVAESISPEVVAESSGTAAVSGKVPESDKKPQHIITSEDTLEIFTVPDLSRAEYVSQVQSLLEWRLANQGRDAEFLQKVDSAWPNLNYPETEREFGLLSELMTSVSAVDEQMRCAAARESMRNEHIMTVETAKKRFEELKNQEIKLANERRLQQQEIARQTLENQRLQQEIEKEQQKRAASIKEEAHEQFVKCVKAMIQTAIDGDEKRFNDAMTLAKSFTQSQKTFSQADAKTIQNLKSKLNSLSKEKDNLRKILQRMQRVDEKRNIRILMERGTALLLGIKPGKLVYRGENGKPMELEYRNALSRTRQSLFMALEKLKFSNAEFYSDILHGKRPDDNKVPGGFWKSVWPEIKTALP